MQVSGPLMSSHTLVVIPSDFEMRFCNIVFLANAIKVLTTDYFLKVILWDLGIRFCIFVFLSSAMKPVKILFYLIKVLVTTNLALQ